MRATELLGCEVVDARGRPLGTVVDLRLARPRPAGGPGPFTVTTVVVDRVHWPHRWGLVPARSSGPFPLRALARAAARGCRSVPVGDVAVWEPGRIQLRSRE